MWNLSPNLTPEGWRHWPLSKIEKRIRGLLITLVLGCLEMVPMTEPKHSAVEWLAKIETWNAHKEISKWSSKEIQTIFCQCRMPCHWCHCFRAMMLSADCGSILGMFEAASRPELAADVGAVCAEDVDERERRGRYRCDANSHRWAGQNSRTDGVGMLNQGFLQKQKVGVGWREDHHRTIRCICGVAFHFVEDVCVQKIDLKWNFHCNYLCGWQKHQKVRNHLGTSLSFFFFSLRLYSFFLAAFSRNLNEAHEPRKHFCIEKCFSAIESTLGWQSGGEIASCELHGQRPCVGSSIKNCSFIIMKSNVCKNFCCCTFWRVLAKGKTHFLQR